MKEPSVSRSGSTNDVPDPEVSAIPKRRRFRGKYKLSILQEVDGASEVGAVGKILRREGLYSSHLTEWRKERDRGALVALEKKRGPKPKLNPLAEENEKLRRETAQLRKRLDQAALIIDVQKKLSSMLGIPLSSHQFDESGS